MKNSIVRSVNFRRRVMVPVSLLFAGWLVMSSEAQIFTLTHSNSVAQINTASSGGMFDWLVEGSDRLAQQWFWFRVGTVGPEASIHTISAPTTNTPDARTLYTRYFNGSFGVEVDYILTGGSIGSGIASIAESVTITNGTAAPLDFHLFEYADFDLGSSDVVRLGTNGAGLFNGAKQTNGLTSADIVITPQASHGEAALFPTTLNRLNDGNATTLNDTAVAGPGDATSALQWDLTIPAFSSISIQVSKTLILTNTCTSTNPCIAVTKTCNTVLAGQPNLITAVVTNCGDVAITGITINDNVYGDIGTVASLAPGGTATLTRSVTNTCGSFPNTVTASGTSLCGTSVQAVSTNTCIVTENPCIGVTKTCDTVLIGQANLLTAVVTNCGNVPLHGITIVDNLYGSVGTIALLAPGGTATLTKSITNTCGNFPNTVTAIGFSPCNTAVTNVSTATCVVTENPCIGVTKTCDSVIAGQANLLTAVVTNCGNVPLHGITVVDNIYGSVGTIALLAPGGTATLTKSVTNTCGNFPNTVTAIGLSPCNTSVTNTSTATCVVTENPCLGVTKTCNSVLVGQPNLLTAVITNCGNVPLHGITVVDNLYGSVGTIALLAPGGTATLTKSVTNICGNFTNVVTAIGLSPCNTSVTNTSTATCVVTCPAPKICVTKEVVGDSTTGCSNNWSHFVSGEKSTNCTVCPKFCYRVRVTNCGSEALNNVTVVDNVVNLAACNFPTTMAVGQTVECIVAGVEHCDNVTNTVTASGVGASSGIGVSTNDSAAVAVICPNLCPTAVFSVVPLAPFTNQPALIAIAVNNSNACVVLNGSASSDPDFDPLTYVWSDGTNNIASGAIVTNCLTVDSHNLCLTVSDGLCPDSTCVTVEVITPCQSIGLLIEKIENSSLARNKKRPLEASLRAACESFEDGRLTPGANQLGAFQSKVRAQIAKDDPALANDLIHDAQVIIDAVGGH